MRCRQQSDLFLQGNISRCWRSRRECRDAITPYLDMSEEIDGPDKLNAAPGEAGNADGDNDGGSGPPMAMRGGRGGFR